MSRFYVAKRILDEEDDAISLEPVFMVDDVPDHVTVAEMKNALEKSGVYDATDWRQYRVVPEAEESAHRWFKDESPREFANEARYDAPVPYPAEDVKWASYDNLLERIKEERRITLRLPLGLHVALSRAASDATSLNSFCINALAGAINYDGKELSEFETERRKPGRPRKNEAGH